MYCETDDVRAVTGYDLTTTDISDTHLYKIMQNATAELNSKINTEIRLELVEEVDSYRQNKVDSSNCTFYISKSWTWYFGDRNNSGTITIDDIKVWEYKNDFTREELTVSSIDETGQFIVSTAPASSSSLYVTYVYAPLSENGLSCHKMIKDALCYLSAAYAYGGIQIRDNVKIKLGDLSVMDMPAGFTEYKLKFEEVMRDINARAIQKGEGNVPTSDYAFELYR